MHQPYRGIGEWYAAAKRLDAIEALRQAAEETRKNKPKPTRRGSYATRHLTRLVRAHTHLPIQTARTWLERHHYPHA